jgi:hypothetical protein
VNKNTNFNKNYVNSNVCHISSSECAKNNVGQLKKILTLFGERVQAFRKNRYNPKFFLHSLENQYPIRKTDGIVKVIYSTVRDRTLIICINCIFIEKPKTINQRLIYVTAH